MLSVVEVINWTAFIVWGSEVGVRGGEWGVGVGVGSGLC